MIKLPLKFDANAYFSERWLRKLKNEPIPEDVVIAGTPCNALLLTAETFSEGTVIELSAKSEAGRTNIAKLEAAIGESTGEFAACVKYIYCRPAAIRSTQCLELQRIAIRLKAYGLANSIKQHVDRFGVALYRSVTFRGYVRQAISHLHKISALQSGDVMTDIELVLDSHDRLKCHKLVLATMSPYFKNHPAIQDADVHEITLVDSRLTCYGVRKMLALMYGRTVTARRSMIKEVFQAAEVFQIDLWRIVRFHCQHHCVCEEEADQPMTVTSQDSGPEL